MVVNRFGVYLLRTMDKTRLVRRLGRVAESTQQAVLAALAELFAP